MTDSYHPFADSYLSKAHLNRTLFAKDSPSYFRNNSSTKAFRSFLNCTVQKNESTIPSDSISYGEERNYRSLKAETFKVLNESKDLASIDKSSFLGVERNNSMTPINDVNAEFKENRTNSFVGDKVIFKRPNNANRPQGGLFLLMANGGAPRGKTGSPKIKKDLLIKANEDEGPRIRKNGSKDRGLKDFRMIYGRQNTSHSKNSDSSLNLKRQLTDSSKLKEAPSNMSKGIETEQKKLDARLCLGDSLDFSNASDSPKNIKIQRKVVTMETEADEKKKAPVHEIYSELLRKHLKGNADTEKQAPVGGRKLINSRPQTCKNSFFTKKDIRNILSPKTEQVTLAQKPRDASPSPNHDKKSINTLTKVTSTRAAVPKILLDGPEIAVTDSKLQKADFLQRPTTAALFNQNNVARPKNNPVHSANNFKFERVLGQGAYAVVKLAHDKVRDDKVAVKIYDKSMLSDPRKMKNVRREISILKEMNHPNVIKLLDSFETPRQIYVVMEFVGKASLHSFLRSLGPKKLEEAEIKRIFKQISQSISYCHQKNIVHRDIKLENILMDDNNNIKIIDFGFSICVGADKKLNFFCGTPSYMAPEIVTKTPYKGHPTDIWALGVILYILLCGHFPFRGADDRELFERIRKAKLEFPPHVSDQAKSFVQKIMKVNADDRPKIEQILQDRWLNT